MSLSQKRNVLTDAVLDGLVPAELLKTTQILFDNFFTVVKMTANTITLKLNDALGGGTFTLDTQWILVDIDNGPMMVETWCALPRHVMYKIARFIGANMPGGWSMNMLVPPDQMRHLIEQAHGKPVDIAGKIFQVHGFLSALSLNLVSKLLYRCVRTPDSLSWASTLKDCARGLASCSAGWLASMALGFAFLNPPLSVGFAVKTIAAIAAAETVDKLIDQ